MHNENQKCALIDRADPDTGEIVPIEGWNKNRTKKNPDKEATTAMVRKLTEDNLQLKEQVAALTKESQRLRKLLP